MHRLDMTLAVDWALKSQHKQLPMYIRSLYQKFIHSKLTFLFFDLHEIWQHVSFTSKARNPYARMHAYACVDMENIKNQKINRMVSLYTDACVFTHDIQIHRSRMPQDAWRIRKRVIWIPSLKLWIHIHVWVCVCVYGKYQNPKINRKGIHKYGCVCVYAWYSNTLNSYANAYMDS